jgi:hypothetical protein
MSARIDNWLTAIFAPVFVMLRDVPASAMTHLWTPF